MNNEKSESEITLRPVGIIRSEIKKPVLTAGKDGIEMREELAEAVKKMRESRETISELVVDDAYEGILDGIDDFSHILVLYWAHMVPVERRSLARVHPMGRREFPLVGIFATCSPARPNPLLATVVELAERDGNILKVRGLDAVDGSPLIDIKPYNSAFYPAGEVRVSEWMERIHREFS